MQTADSVKKSYYTCDDNGEASNDRQDRTCLQKNIIKENGDRSKRHTCQYKDINGERTSQIKSTSKRSQLACRGKTDRDINNKTKINEEKR